MARRSHTRQKSDDSKLNFELVEVETNLTSESVSFPRPKISCFATRLWQSLREQLVLFDSRVRRIPINLTILSIVVLFLSLAIPTALGLVSILAYTPAVDISLQSFQIPTQTASLNEDAFKVASRHSSKVDKDPEKTKHRRSAVPLPDPWPMPSDPKGKGQKWYKYTQYRSKWNIDLIYLPQGKDKNMFNVETLLAAHRFEQNVIKYPGFTDFCWKWSKARLDPVLSNKFNACTPPISLIDFFFPTQYLGMSFFDGQGANLTALAKNQTLKFLLSKQFTYWFVDGHFSAENPRSSFLRAQIKFGYPLKGYNRRGYNRGAKLREQNEKYQAFMKKFIKIGRAHV